MPDKDVKREQDDVREARRDLRHEKGHGDGRASVTPKTTSATKSEM